MSLKITILGCGSSAGVPRVAQGWGACDPQNSRNRRRRCSILVEQLGPQGVTQVLIDTSPDVREQLLDVGLTRLDAILLTHPHADHIHGIDDVRPIVAHMGEMIDVHMDAPTSAVMKQAFGYIFETQPGSVYPPLLREKRLTPGIACRVDVQGGALEAIPFRLNHGEIDALGFRFGAMAYTPDVKSIPPESEPFLKKLDLWIIDSLRVTPHPTHISLPEALGLIDFFKPRRAILTNLSNELDYETMRGALPAHIRPAHDGLIVELDI